MIGCLLAEGWWWRGQGVGAGVGTRVRHGVRHGNSHGNMGTVRSRKTWEQCARDDMKLLGLHPEWAISRDMWRDLIWGKHLT